MSAQGLLSLPITSDAPPPTQRRERLRWDWPETERLSAETPGDKPRRVAAVAESGRCCKVEDDKPDFVAALKGCLRILAAVVLRLYVGAYHRLRIVGCEHLPIGSSFVLVANHTSHVDLFCLLAALPLTQRSRVFPAIAQDYFCKWRIWMILAKWTINALPFNRRAKYDESLQECELLLSGPEKILLFFPEGTRSATGELARFRPGLAFLAAGRDIPIVPCHITGAYAAWPKGQWIPRPTTLRLTIGAPRNYVALPRTREGREQLCQDLREAVNVLNHSTTGAGQALACREQQVTPPIIVKSSGRNPGYPDE